MSLVAINLMVQKIKEIYYRSVKRRVAGKQRVAGKNMVCSCEFSHCEISQVAKIFAT